MDLINLPYCFLFIPLIFSGIAILQNYKMTNSVITVFVASVTLILGFYLIPEVLPNNILQNKINNDPLFILGEYKITLKNLIFLILIFFTKLISFMFFDESMIYTRKVNFFFSIYLINYFSISGILLSNNIFNLFIYIEFYSFSLYNLMADYKQENYADIAYKYYTNGVLGSILLMFFVFIVYFTFGSSDIDYITSNLNIISDNYLYNLSIVIFLVAMMFKFFSFNFYFSGVLKSADITNLLFVNILFSDIIIGIYILWKFLYSLFNISIIFDVFHLDYLLFILGTLLIVYATIRTFERKNLLPTVYSFALIMLGYVIILIGLDNDYSFVSIISLIINHVLVNYLFYIIVALCVFLFGKSNTPVLYCFYKYRYIIYTIILSKLSFPIAFGFNADWNYILSTIHEGAYYLFIPFIFEKVLTIFLFVRYYYVFSREPREDYMYFTNISTKISINTNYMVSIFVLYFLVISVSFLEGTLGNILFNYISIGAN